MINIIDMLDDEPPCSQVKGSVPVLFGSGSFAGADTFVIAPENFTRKMKLAYIEYAYKSNGPAADQNKFVLEFKYGRGLSREVFLKSREYGLYCYTAERVETK